MFSHFRSTRRFDEPGDDTEGALAEFTALRAEVVHALSVQQSIFALQLTSAGAIFTFALASPSRIRMLLILPFTSYALCARYSSAHFGTLVVGRYIKDVLSPRVPGGLLWEDWHARQPRPIRFIGWISPNFVTFIGPGVVALIWTFSSTFLKTAGLATMTRIGFALLWAAALAVTGMSIVVAWRMTARRREIDNRSHLEDGPMPGP